MSREIATVVTDLTYLECPRWPEGRIWFVDFYTYRVLSATAAGPWCARRRADEPAGLGHLR